MESHEIFGLGFALGTICGGGGIGCLWYASQEKFLQKKADFEKSVREFTQKDKDWRAKVKQKDDEFSSQGKQLKQEQQRVAKIFSNQSKHVDKACGYYQGMDEQGNHLCSATPTGKLIVANCPGGDTYCERFVLKVGFVSCSKPRCNKKISADDYLAAIRANIDPHTYCGD